MCFPARAHSVVRLSSAAQTENRALSCFFTERRRQDLLFVETNLVVPILSDVVVDRINTRMNFRFVPPSTANPDIDSDVARTKTALRETDPSSSCSTKLSRVSLTVLADSGRKSHDRPMRSFPVVLGKFLTRARPWTLPCCLKAPRNGRGETGISWGRGGDITNFLDSISQQICRWASREHRAQTTEQERRKQNGRRFGFVRASFQPLSRITIGCGDAAFSTFVCGGFGITVGAWGASRPTAQFRCFSAFHFLFSL